MVTMSWIRTQVVTAGLLKELEARDNSSPVTIHSGLVTGWEATGAC